MRNPVGRSGRRMDRLEARLVALEQAVDESRRLSQRLDDLIDVVVEVLVPAADRDDDRLREALARFHRELEPKPAQRSL